MVYNHWYRYRLPFRANFFKLIDKMNSYNPAGVYQEMITILAGFKFL